MDFSFQENCLLFGLPERNDEFAIINSIGQNYSPSQGPDDDDTIIDYDLRDPRTGVPYRMFTNDHFSD